MPITSYSEALRYLSRPARQAGDLLPLTALLRRLGQPQRSFMSILVAGGHGKSIVVSLLSRTLQAAGYRVGTFSTPHLHSLRECIRIDDRMIDQQALIKQINALSPAVEVGPGPFTSRELLSVLAARWFAIENVNIAIMEVETEPDATHYAYTDTVLLTPFGEAGVAQPEISNLSIGENSLIVSATQSPEAERSIRAAVQARSGRLVMVGEMASWQWQINRSDPTIADYLITCGEWSIEGQTRLIGEHNIRHLAQVVAWAYMAWRERSSAITLDHVRAAAQSLKLPAHAELLPLRGGLVLLDMVSTTSRLEATADLIGQLKPYARIYLVGLPAVLEERVDLLKLPFQPGDCLLLTSQVEQDIHKLKALQHLMEYAGFTPTILVSPSEALSEALSRCHANHLLIVLGGPTFVGPIREELGLIAPELCTEAEETRLLYRPDICLMPPSSLDLLDDRTIWNEWEW